jgi:hypothetical protein
MSSLNNREQLKRALMGVHQAALAEAAAAAPSTAGPSTAGPSAASTAARQIAAQPQVEDSSEEDDPDEPADSSSDELAENNPDISSEGHTVFEDSCVKAVIKKKAFKRQKKFNLTDFNFAVRLYPKSGYKSKLLSTVLEILSVIIIACLQFIKEKLDIPSRPKTVDDYHRQVYGVLIFPNLNKAISTGNYSIRTDPHLMALLMINKLTR